jgi:uncharacterized protein (DUF2236 family)
LLCAAKYLPYTVPVDTAVKATDLDQRLRELCPGSPVEGLFGPASETWRIGRESALFAGAWRAALLQLAHPWVAQSIEDHSDTEHDPAARFRRTFRVIFTFLFGDAKSVFASARKLHALHETITGELKDASPAFARGSNYGANHREAMTWVLYTLWDTALLAYDSLVEPLTEERKNAYVREGGRFGALFGLDPSALPGSFAAMRAEMDRMIQHGPVSVTPTARRLAGFLLWPRPLWFKPLWAPVAKVVTAHWMPAPLRDGFGLPAYGDRAAKFFLSTARLGRKLLPGALKYVPPYHEAQSRLRGSPRAAGWVRGLNRLWLGQPELVAGGSESLAAPAKAGPISPSP